MALQFDDIDVPNFPALCFPDIDNVSLSFSNAYPDEAITTPVIPLRLKRYDPPARKLAVDAAGAAPALSNNLTAYPNKAAFQGIRELPKVVMEGYIDTPTIGHGEEYRMPRVVLYQDPADLAFDLSSDQLTGEGIRVTWGHLISMLNDGDEIMGWERVDPLWFRDPFGKIYNNPRIIAYEASYVEQVPCRNTFNMTLKI